MRWALYIFLMVSYASDVFAQQTINSLCEEVSQYARIDDAVFNPSASEVPADINRIQDPVLGSISIPVDIDLAEYFDRPELRGVPGLLLEPEISNVEINSDGSVFYNGQEVSEDLRRVCGTAVPSTQDTSEVAPKPKAKVPETEAKPKLPSKKTMKKSSVKVTTGDEVVIDTSRDSDVSQGEGASSNTPVVKPPNKPDILRENLIDVTPTKEQDIMDDPIASEDGSDDDAGSDNIIEGQYP